MRSAIISLVCLSVASPALVAAQGAAIDHKKVACFVAGKHPRLASCFTPAALGEGSRVVLITADTLVFRVQGKAGERLAFTFHLQRE